MNLRPRFLRPLCLFPLLWTPLFVASAAGARTDPFTDHAGRPLEPPAAAQRVYATGPPSIVALYMLDPDLMAGWCTPFSLPEQRFIPEKYRRLPILGGRYGLKGTMNPEVVLRARPDMVLTLSAGPPEKAGDEADRLQRQLRAPVLLLDGRLESIPRMFRTLGQVLRREERAERLAAWAQRLLDDTKTRVAAIPEDKRVRVYYAEGPRGLNTDPRGSWHSETLEFAGGVNVAEGGDLNGYGRSPVSLEQVIAWKPDVILVNDDAGTQGDVLSLVRRSPAWRQVKAVREGRVYKLPHGPFNWFDRPPAANRLGGVLWLRHLLYPELFDGNFDAAVREFFRLFYRHELTEEDMEFLNLRAK